MDCTISRSVVRLESWIAVPPYIQNPRPRTFHRPPKKGKRLFDCADTLDYTASIPSPVTAYRAIWEISISEKGLNTWEIDK